MAAGLRNIANVRWTWCCENCSLLTSN